MRNPVWPLFLSLYGHPDSGGYWEQRCEGHATAQGFLSGPADKLAEGWKLLQTPSDNCLEGIEIDLPTAVGRYLGCEHRLSRQFVEWQGELPTVLDPPPPKVKKNASFPDESSEEGTGGDSAAQ
eukprot:7367838-Pyramimonas_sp.AAC.1